MCITIRLENGLLSEFGETHSKPFRSNGEKIIRYCDLHDWREDTLWFLRMCGMSRKKLFPPLFLYKKRGELLKR